MLQLFGKIETKNSSFVVVADIIENLAKNTIYKKKILEYHEIVNKLVSFIGKSASFKVIFL